MSDLYVSNNQEIIEDCKRRISNIQIMIDRKTNEVDNLLGSGVAHNNIEIRTRLNEIDTLLANINSYQASIDKLKTIDPKVETKKDKLKKKEELAELKKPFDFNNFLKDNENIIDAMIGSTGFSDNNAAGIRFNRFGKIDLNQQISTTKEFVFFTKPDLALMVDNAPNPELIKSSSFFNLFFQKYKHLIPHLQSSYTPIGEKTPNASTLKFTPLLTNHITSTLDIPEISPTMVSTSTNIYGTSYEYRGTSEPSDDNFSFSLEFRDNPNTDIYMYFKAYDEYCKLKKRGQISIQGTRMSYLTNRVMHEAVSIYKFILDSDFSRIIFFGKYTGVIYKNINRDAFSNISDGLNITVSCQSAFFDDNDPMVLSEFNNVMLHEKLQSERYEDYSIYNTELGMVNMAPGDIAYVTRRPINGKMQYFLKWGRELSHKTDSDMVLSKYLSK